MINLYEYIRIIKIFISNEKLLFLIKFEVNMVNKKHVLLSSFLLAAFVLIIAGLYSMDFTNAEKSEAVQSWSNGFPSGPHFNLNIHGKSDSFACNPSSDGSSIFVKEYGYSEIQYIMNRKSSLSELSVIDPCAMGESDPAKIQLPSGKYQVYARVLGKPGNQKTGEERSVVFYPKIVDACNDNETAPIDGFDSFIDCSAESLMELGVVTANGAFTLDETKLTRIAPVRGKNQAQPITDMFYWTGYACDDLYDTNNDGEITMDDLAGIDFNNDGVFNTEDLNYYLEFNCQYFDDAWVFDIADLVVYGWDYYNQGTKLVQVRFYPESTTVYS